jgi:glycosyltransferase involved in cell wall biosynthesis
MFGSKGQVYATQQNGGKHKMQNTNAHVSNFQPRVSVILPTYNRAEIIKKCIDSVLLQSYDNWELIICDDCSTDDTENVCRQYSAKMPNIRYIKSSVRNGLPKNRNIGLKRAKGKLIFFIEDDLALERECLEVLVTTYDGLKANESVGGIAPRLIERCGEVYPGKEPFIFNKLTGEVTNNYMVCSEHISEVVTLHACSMYPKTLLEVVGGYEEEAYIGNFLREETDLNFRIKKLGYKFYFQPNAVAQHNRIESGGCRTGTLVYREIYSFRNHLVFLLRIFGVKSIYMIPSYIISYSLQFLRYIIRSVIIALKHRLNKNSNI